MLNHVIHWSIRHRIAVIVAAGVLACLGFLAFLRLPMDAFPDTTPVQVQINTVAESLSPLEIERQITFPVEQVISGLPGLTEVRSISKFGLSQVTAIFKDGTEIYFARQVISERLRDVAVPEGIDPPSLGPVATGLGEIFHYLVTGAGKSLAELRVVQDWIIKPQLRTVPGVAEVNTWGGDERQLHVLVDPNHLANHGLTLSDLVEALERNNTNVGGGMLTQAGQAASIQGIGIVTTPADVEDIILTTQNGTPTRVRDVARVVFGREIRRGATTADGVGEVVLGLGFMLMGENSHEVARSLRLRLDEIRRSVPNDVQVTTVYDRTELVDHVLQTVRVNLLEGALLVVAVLFVFLGNLRAGLIVASAIPLSMLFAFDLMLRAGIAGTLMSLGAIDFGLIVDSSVIMVENATRRLSENDGGLAREVVVRDAAIEVRRPTMFGELIIMIVYLPILALEGIEGKLFRPMAMTVIFALLGSLVLSLTLMPALSATLLPSRMSHQENWLVARLKRLYRPVVEGALARPKRVLILAGLVLAGAGVLATRLGSEFIPRLYEGAIVVNTVRLAGVSLEESVRYGVKIEKVLLDSFPDEIERVWTRTGTAEVATDAMGLEVSDIFITLKPRGQWKKAGSQAELVAEMQECMSGLPGMRAVFTQPIEMRVNEMIAGIRSDVGVKLYGDDFETLEAKAREIEALVEETPGSADVYLEQLTGQPILEVAINREAIARHGISVGTALDAVSMLGTREVGLMQEGERRFPIAVSLDERYRQDADAVGRILVASDEGDRVPLERLSTIRMKEGPSTINREWGKRRVVIQTNVRGRDVGGFVADLKRAIETRIALPTGYYVRFGGQFEHLERARTRLMIVVPVALALIFGLLYLTYHRVVDAARVFTGVPFAAVGGIAALWLRDMPFSISAAVGFVALSGVSVLADMVLVSTIRQNVADGLPLQPAILQAAERRLRPVLMTALVASFGFVPMAFNTGFGAEVQRPLATVVIGGLISSTLLTLVVLPVLYSVFSGREKLSA